MYGIQEKELFQISTGWPLKYDTHRGQFQEIFSRVTYFYEIFV